MPSVRRLFQVLVVVCLVFRVNPVIAQSTPRTPLDQFACGGSATQISSIQGAGAGSPMIGAEVDVEAVVVGLFQNPEQLGGLFIQEEDLDQDNDAQTSEGLFVHTSLPAQVGDLVRLRGTVTEFKGLTELHPVTQLEVCRPDQVLPTPAIVYLPATSMNDFEAVENMRVSLPQTLKITDLYNLPQFGELVVSSKRLNQPTQVALPGQAARDLAQANALDQLIVDDGRNGRNLPIELIGQDNATSFNAHNTVRTGQEISGLAGVMHYGFGAYRLQPDGLFAVDQDANPRTPAPAPVGGTLRLAVFNTLNYFSTLNHSGALCGPSRNQPCRGADNQQEQTRQRQKLLATLSAIDADILGLVELENNTEKSLQQVVAALNSETGTETYSYVNAGIIGRDAIKVGLLFKPSVVALAGPFAVLDSGVDARFDDNRSRPALAQTFLMRNSEDLLTIIVTHLKSKGCSGASGADSDQGDGQDCFNRTRSEATAALADWALSYPTGTGSEYVLVFGDFNSARMEDPIRLAQEKSLVDLLPRFDVSGPYSYVYKGLTSTLDYAFSSRQLSPHVSGATAWHINADESHALDYNDEPGKSANYFAASPYRSSDHDPIIVGLNLGHLQTPADMTTPREGLSTLHYVLLAGVPLLLLLLGVSARKIL